MRVPRAGDASHGEGPGRCEPCEDAGPRSSDVSGRRPSSIGAPVFAGLPLVERTRRQILNAIGEHPAAVDAHLSSVRLAEDRQRRQDAPGAAGAPLPPPEPERPATADVDGGSGRFKAAGNPSQPAATDAGTAGVAPLDTLGISRQTSAATTVSAISVSKALARKTWMSKVAVRASPYCEQRATELDATSKARRSIARRAGRSQEEVKSAGKWHADRARGYRFRFENVDGCGQEGPKQLEVTCTECGSVIPHPITCGCSLLCIHCRGRLQAKRREEVARAQELIRDHAKRLGLMRRNRARKLGGRWSGKFVVLTIPHDGLNLEERIELMHLAVPHFLRAMRRWFTVSLRAKKVKDSRGRDVFRELAHGPNQIGLIHWYGSHEWTLGSDHEGHPHFQFWIFSPYIPGHVLDDAWHRALEQAGLGQPVMARKFREDTIGKYRAVTVYDGPLLSVDIREEYDVKGGVCELVKYIVKDVVAEGDFLEPDTFARVYRSLDRRRMRRGSPGFIAMGKAAKPCACGAEGCWQVRIVPRSPSDPSTEGAGGEGGAVPRAPP